jgi:hypothetical protein
MTEKTKEEETDLEKLIKSQKDIIKDIRAEANTAKSCVTQYSFQTLVISGALLSVTVAFLKIQNPSAAPVPSSFTLITVLLINIPAIFILRTVCRIAMHKYTVANRCYGYQMSLERATGIFMSMEKKQATTSSCFKDVIATTPRMNYIAEQEWRESQPMESCDISSNLSRYKDAWKLISNKNSWEEVLHLFEVIQSNFFEEIYLWPRRKKSNLVSLQYLLQKIPKKTPVEKLFSQQDNTTFDPKQTAAASGFQASTSNFPRRISEQPETLLHKLISLSLSRYAQFITFFLLALFSCFWQPFMWCFVVASLPFIVHPIYYLLLLPVNFAIRACSFLMYYLNPFLYEVNRDYKKIFIEKIKSSEKIWFLLKGENPTYDIRNGYLSGTYLEYILDMLMIMQYLFLLASLSPILIMLISDKTIKLNHKTISDFFGYFLSGSWGQVQEIFLALGNGVHLSSLSLAGISAFTIAIVIVGHIHTIRRRDIIESQLLSVSSQSMMWDLAVVLHYESIMQIDYKDYFDFIEARRSSIQGKIKDMTSNGKVTDFEEIMKSLISNSGNISMPSVKSPVDDDANADKPAIVSPQSNMLTPRTLAGSDGDGTPESVSKSDEQE